MTYQEALKSISAYPIQFRTLAEISESRGINLLSNINADDFKSKSYRLAKADLLYWLSFAPNVSQGGQSFSFSEEQRKAMKIEANAIYSELEPEKNAVMPTFGYKGDKL